MKSHWHLMLSYLQKSSNIKLQIPQALQSCAQNRTSVLLSPHELTSSFLPHKWRLPTRLGFTLDPRFLPFPSPHADLMSSRVVS